MNRFFEAMKETKEKMKWTIKEIQKTNPEILERLEKLEEIEEEREELEGINELKNFINKSK